MAFLIRVAEVLHLEALVFVEGSQQQAELVLELVQVRGRAVGQVGGVQAEPLGDVTAAPQVIEHNQVANEEAVGSATS